MNTFSVLAVGDVFAAPGRAFLAARLPALKKELGVGLCIVNGENSADTNGINSDGAAELFAAGADVITTGNHAFQKSGSRVFENERVIRPANYNAALPGKGFCIVDCGPVRVQVINAAGRVGMEPADNPFDAVEACLRERGDAAVTVLDFHAEATSEKKAVGYYFDGKIGLVFGTHTHVQTADERLLPAGTAYLTDVGMTGVRDSIIGLQLEAGIERLRVGPLARPVAAEGPCQLNAVLVTFERNGKPLSIRRVNLP